MNYKAAKQLVKERAGSKYSGRQLLLLQKLTDSLYTPDGDADIDGKLVRRKVVTIQGWLAGVSDRQLRTIIGQVEEIRVVSRVDGVLTVALNLALLNKAENTAQLATRVNKQRRADRATKARAQRAEQRRAQFERRAERYLPEEWW